MRTTSMNDTFDKMAVEYDRHVAEVPVGFKNVCEQMLNPDILIGAKQMPLSEMVNDLRQKYGPFCYGRIDKHFDLKVLQHNLRLLRKKPPEKIGAVTVDKVSLIDGIKYYLLLLGC